MAQAGTNWNAIDYANNASAQYAWAQSLIEQLDLAGNENILDVGCGDGRITAEIAHAVRGRVVGIDGSAQMVSLAKQHYQTSANKLSFRQMDATRLIFEEEFELVFSNAVLHWVHDHVAVLAGVYRSLRRGGRMVFSMGGKGNAADLLPLVDQLIRQAKWSTYFTDFEFPYAFYGIDEYADWLPQVGLQPQRIELVAKDMVHENIKALKGWIRTTWFPYTSRVPQEHREDFINELIDMYLAQHPVDADSRTHVRMIRLEVEATKVK